MKNPNPNMLLRIGQADACAAACEYLKPRHCRKVTERTVRFTKYVQHPTHLDVAPGQYTDDAEMSTANALVLIENGPTYTAYMYADAWVREFARSGGRKGYARGFQKFLEGVKTGQEFIDRCKGDSDKNGAAMRAAPFGVLPTPELVVQQAILQAMPTHFTPDGLYSSCAVALASHFALHSDEPLSRLPDFLGAHLPPEYLRDNQWTYRTRWPGGEVHRARGKSVALNTVHAAFDQIIHGTSLMGMLKQAIEWGGDTDSVAAIIWGVASARYQDERLPAFLERDLERGDPRTGAAYLKDVGRRLMDKFGK